MMESESELQRGQSLISKAKLEKMGKELIELCDGLEKHGLVDFEYGVWEELIEQSMRYPFRRHEFKDGAALRMDILLMCW